MGTGDMHKFRDKLHVYYDRVMGPVARMLVRLKVTPNQVSMAGAVFNVAAAVFIINGHFVIAGVLYLTAGGLDLLERDGSVSGIASSTNTPNAAAVSASPQNSH